MIVMLPRVLTAQGFLRTSGTQIVDGDGKEFILKGIGLGGWLVPEGYMLQTSNFAASPSEIRDTIASLIGDGNTKQFFHLYRKNYVSRRDIERIAQWGFNSIRLPMHYGLFVLRDPTGIWLDDGFSIVDSLLSWCESNHLYLILDLHCAPGGQNNQNISDYDPRYPSLWESTQNQAETVDLWRTLAARYAKSEWIGGYDLLNEPAWNLGPANQPLRDLYINITDAIRQVDTNHIVFVEGNWYATDFTGLTPPWDSRMAYSFHKYWNSNSSGSISGYINLRNTSQVPLWMGESGENSNSWFADCIALLESNKIGWSWWPHKKIESIAGPLSAKKTPQYDYLLKYWSGQVPRPLLTYATGALYDMASRLNIDSCTFHPDVIDAIIRQPLDNTRRPFADNNIPGIIYAVNFDYGRNLIAYRDIDFENTGSTGWNIGGQFRNDGVDIETCSDKITNAYDVGWIESGEYLNFTVQVKETRAYGLAFRTAANVAGGKILVRWDGQNLTDFVDIPATGGWQTWQTVRAGEYLLAAGAHSLSVAFFFGGFNLNYVEFSPTTTSVRSHEASPARFNLEQNYPNPFNPTTVIRYDIPGVRDLGSAASGQSPAPSGVEGSAVSLKVFDLLGREVAVLVNEKKPPGSYDVTFEAAGLASGVYLCRLQVRSSNSLTQDFEMGAGNYVQTMKMLLLR
jgi:endoglucanase